MKIWTFATIVALTCVLSGCGAYKQYKCDRNFNDWLTTPGCR